MANQGSSVSLTNDDTNDEDRYLYSIVKYCIDGDQQREAALLLKCRLELREEVEEYNFSDPCRTLVLILRGPRVVFETFHDDTAGVGSPLRHAVESAGRALLLEGYDVVRAECGLAVADSPPADWKNEILAALEGKNIDNQAVGFKAIETWEGLRFRSQSEVKIAQELDRKGVMFFPNCRARVGTLDRRRNVEADFAVMLDGVWGILEIDGPHHEGKAANDHVRDRAFHYHGAAIVQRYNSLDCFNDPEQVVLQFLALLKSKAR